MKKKNILLFFLKNLLISLIAIAVILGVGVGSYAVSYKVLTDMADKGVVVDSEIDDILEQAKTDEVSKNLIYVADDNNKITAMMLEICNTDTCNMDYITIPINTQYTIPSNMYQKLCVISEEIPQIITLSKIRQYFKTDGDDSTMTEDDAYGYASLIIEKMIGVDISYYTVINEATYESHYDTQKVTVKYTKAKSSSNATPTPLPSSTPVKASPLKMKISVASDSYIEELTALGGDEDKIVAYIKAAYKNLTSNLTVYNKIGYIEAYEKMNPSYFHFWGIPGAYSSGTFTVDTASAKKYINGIINNATAYTTEQDYTQAAPSGTATAAAVESTASSTGKKTTSSSKGLDIIVLNGSKITGLAASYQTKLQDAGYTVPKVGDYTSEVLTQTKIIVSKKGQGTDLESYFSNPQITVGDVQDGYDIEIILGTVDANNE